MGLLRKTSLVRVKINMMDFLRSDSFSPQNFVRVLLVAALLFYLSLMLFYPAQETVAAPLNADLEEKDGIGGSFSPEKTQLNLELSGIPEPEEYSRPHMLAFGSYTLERGDMIGNIAMSAGLDVDSLISVNNIKNTRLMQIGQTIRIPNQDGIYYEVKKGDTLGSIAAKYNTSVYSISTANELFADTINAGEKLFVPGAKLELINRQEINGDLFIWPCRGYISSSYGYRIAPFAGTRQFHSGIDISSPMGTPVRAAMAGRVIQVGANDYSWGNFVVISHHSGYRTFYAHLSVVRVKAGAYVETNERIGDVGSTGLSTGPHLHFTVYKNGVTVNPRALMR